ELELRRPRDRELAAEGDHRLVRDRQAAVPGERRALPDRARGDLETQLSAVQVDLAAGVERDAGEDDGVRTGRDERLRDRERPAVVHAGRVDAALEAGEPRSDDGRQLARRTVVEADVAADLDQRRADRQAAVVRDQRAERVVGRAVDRACGRTAEEDGRVERAAAPAEGLRHVNAAALDRGRPGEGERAEVDVVAELDLRRRLPGDVGEDGVVVGRPRARVLLLALV